MSLDSAPQGTSVMVVRVQTDGKTRRHLENLGIMPGTDVTPLTRENGNMIVRVHDSRIAINGSVAESIIVRSRPVFA